MRPFPSNQLLDVLLRYDDWLSELGIPKRTNDRLHQITHLLQKTESARLRARDTGQLPVIGDFQDYLFGMAAGLEFYQIYQAFRDEPRERIAPKLARAIEGPCRIADESARNNVGRNTAFELALASELRLRGADVAIGEPDIVLRIGGKHFIIECKRPLKIESVRANIRSANQQLARALDKCSNGHAFGLIAVSISRIFTRGERYFRAESMADVQLLGDELDTFLVSNRDRWWSLEFDERVAAVLMHLSIPADVGGHAHLSLMSTCNAYQTGRNREGVEALDSVLSSLYAEP